MIELTEENFKKEVLENSQYVLVDFYLNGCPPCKIIMPIISNIAKEYKNSIKFCKAEINNVPNYASEYSIASAPTVFLFKNGDPVSFFIGYKTKTEIQEWIEKTIS